jgi:hypothetical protein
MRIDFSKRIEGKDALGNYVKEHEPVFMDDNYGNEHKLFFINFSYDLYGLTEHLMQSLEASLAANNNTAIRSSNRDLWVSSPVKLSISFTDIASFKPERQYWTQKKEIVDEQEIRYLTLPYKFGLWTRDLPVESFTPYVDVKGKICYERVDDVEPTPIIKLLRDLGYGAVVITTPMEK